MSQANLSDINQKKRGLLYNIVRYRELYLFLLLPVAYLIIFKYIPMAGIQIAFKDYNIRGGIWGSKWIGIDNFIKFFTSYQFARVLPNTLRISIYGLLAGFPIPIIFALLLNTMRSAVYKKTVQMVTYIPYFVSTVVLVGMVFQLFNPRVGLYGTLFNALTSAGEAPDILASPDAFPNLYVWSGIWQGMGWGSIIYVAALTSVDMDQHEAAQIDGASRLARIWYIDIPAILPTATIMLILNAGHIMGVGFEKVYLMQNNLNMRASEVISTYVYKVGMAAGGGDFSYATTIDLFNSVVNLVLLITVNAITKKLSETSLW